MLEQEYVAGEGWVYRVEPDCPSYSDLLSNYPPEYRGDFNALRNLRDGFHGSLDASQWPQSTISRQENLDAQWGMNRLMTEMALNTPTVKKIGNAIHVFDKVEQRRE